MLYQKLSIIDTIISNCILIFLWHSVVLIVTKNINIAFFNPQKYLYREKKWEKGGTFYIKYLKIKKWKDYIPQYVGKDGFSKRNLIKNSKISLEYINQFIYETCRAEWNHLVCCILSFSSYIFNTNIYNFIFLLLPITINLPCLFIQRYNRIRLNKLVLKKFYAN